MNADRAWQATLDELSLRMTPATFANWLTGTSVLSSEDHAVTVAVRNRYAQEWLDERLRPVIEKVAARHFPAETTLHFAVDMGELAPPAPITQGDGVLEEAIMEAVHEEKVQVGGPGGSFGWNDYYIKLKLAFRKKALAALKGAPLSVFLCLALHLDKEGVAAPGLETIMRETGYSKSIVCNALERLVELGLATKESSYRGNDQYRVNGYAWFGTQPADSMWEK